MSNELDSTPPRTLMSSENPASDKFTNNHDWLCFEAARLLQVVNSWLSGEVFTILAARVSRLIRGSWLPGMGDSLTVAGLTNKSDLTIEDIVVNQPRQKYKVGSTTMFRLTDMAIIGDSPEKVAPAKRKPKR